MKTVDCGCTGNNSKSQVLKLLVLKSIEKESHAHHGNTPLHVNNIRLILKYVKAIVVHAVFVIARTSKSFNFEGFRRK